MSDSEAPTTELFVAGEDRERVSEEGRHTAVGTLQNLGARAVALSTGFATTVFLTRQLGPELYGQYSVAFGIILWIELVVASILRSATVRLVAETDDWQAVSSSLMRIQLLIAGAAAALLAATAPTLSAALNFPALTNYLRLFAVEIPLFALTSAHRSTLIGKGAFGQGAIVTVVYWLSRIALMLLLVGLGLSVGGAIIANVGASAAQLITSRIFVQPALRRRSPVRVPLQRIARYAIPLATYSMGQMVFTKGDLLIVKASAAAPSAAGFYSAATDLALVPIAFLIGSFTPLLLAKLTQMWEGGQSAGAQSIAEQALRLALCLIPFAAVASGTGAGIITLVYGESYLLAGPLLALLTFAAVGYAVIDIAAHTLIARGRPGLTLLFSLPIVAPALAAYLILTPRFGPRGAAATRTVLTGLWAVAMLAILSRTCRVRLSRATMWRTGLTTALAFAASSVWQTSGLLVILELLLLSLGIVGCLVLLGELTERDWQFAVSLLRPAPRSPSLEYPTGMRS